MRQIDVHKLADEARFNGFHGLVLFWCALIIVFDGYDLAVVGIALPSIMKEMGVDATSAGFMVSAALLGKGLIESYGWQSVFLAAAAPVLLIPFILKSLPESMPVLIRRGRFDELKRIASRLEPGYRPQANDRFAVPAEDKADSAPIRHLFHEGRGASTVMFWIAFFMCLFMVYALSSWLTKLMVSAGYSLGSALTFVLVFNFGAILGAAGGGWLADRLPIKYVLAGMYVLAAVSITLLGYPVPTPLLFVLVALAGAATIGTQIVNLAYAGQFYPMAGRATGLGWALGVGRAGAILAPIVIGTLVAMQLPLQQNFMAVAVPALLAMVAILLIDDRRSAASHHEDVSAEIPDEGIAAQAQVVRD